MQIDVSLIGPKKSFIPAMPATRSVAVKRELRSGIESKLCKRHCTRFYSNLDIITGLFSQLIKSDIKTYRNSAERQEFVALLKVNFNQVSEAEQLGYKDQSIVLVAKVSNLIH
ncbi:MAG: hypothetical protein HRU20_04365 [Pseudomonadales bacterium]|nr:hypothetical protein [Pseudomonadales bacterium]